MDVLWTSPPSPFWYFKNKYLQKFARTHLCVKSYHLHFPLMLEELLRKNREGEYISPYESDIDEATEVALTIDVAHFHWGKKRMQSTLK